MSRIPVNGVRLNVERTGSGKPLLLLHGFTGSTQTWRPFQEIWGAGSELIAVDLLGHGRSDSLADPARYRVERAVQDLAALLDMLGLPRVDLLGYSMGGRLALHLALAAPRRIGRLVLESASPGIEDVTERAARVRSDEALATLLEREGIAPFVDRWERLPLFAGQMTLRPEVRERVRRQRLANNPVGLAGSLRGFGAGVPEPLFRRLPEIGCPTLIVVGEQDEKYCSLGRRMADAMSRARLRVVPGAGHTVHLEQPERFGKIVKEFLGEETEYIDHYLEQGARLHRYPVRARRG